MIFIQQIKNALYKKFNMTELKNIKHYFNMKITCNRTNQKLYLLQKHYIVNVLKQFNMKLLKFIFLLINSHTHITKSTSKNPANTANTHQY